ncbi:YdcF family protein [Eisenbergiella tayi]|uniref:YdcF family protein n=1 Tax=Eisenbergiella tayi TaxID=1432052 RepID=UPI000472B777|nr:YdcF family protein [Eisenbergiella tayi]
MKKMTYVFIALGVICLLYCAGILISGVYGSWFFLIWGITGTAFLALAWLYQKNIWLRLPGIIQKLMIAAILTGAFLFLFIEAMIISKFTSKGIPDLDYLIVLGAQMRETGPSKALALRLDTAAAYLTENPDTLVVVSGGKGSNEPISEAQGMYEYLLTKGISPDRILLEDRSTNTKENLQFSRPLIPQDATVGIVTNNFHVYRSTRLAAQQGYSQAYGLSAPSDTAMQANNMFREFFGVVKDLLYGNMTLR